MEEKTPRQATVLDKIVEVFTANAQTKEQFIDGVRATQIIDELALVTTEVERETIMHSITFKIRGHKIRSTADVIAHLRDELKKRQ